MSAEEFSVLSGGERLDVFLTERTELTRSHIKKLIEAENVSVNGCAAKAGRILMPRDVVRIEVPPPRELFTLPEDIPISIVYEDSDIAVIDKAQGMTVHPAAGSPSGTLVNALLYRLDSLSGINGEIRPGIVHRLDKDTSGLIVVAKNDKAHTGLAKQIADKTCRRIYRAILDGSLKSDSGVIETLIGRSPSDRKKMAVTKSGRAAVTSYRVIERFRGFTYAEFELSTGRTHQIRVHAKHLGHPVTGDPVYNGKENRFGVKGQLLHAYKLAFKHPISGKELEFIAPPHETFAKVLEILQKM